MADLPYFPLFPSDWLLETKSLTLMEKGALLELACSIHSSAKRGYLLFDGKPMPLERVARVLGTDKQTAQDILNTLLNSGVLEKELETGVLFYPSMVKRDKLRKTRQEVGRKGGLSTHPPNFTQAKPEQIPKQISGTGTGNGIASEGGEQRGVGNRYPTLTEVLTECSMRCILPACGESFWDTMEGCGWIDNKHRPVVDWRAVLRVYAKNWRANDHQRSMGSNGGNPRPPDPDLPNFTGVGKR